MKKRKNTHAEDVAEELSLSFRSYHVTNLTEDPKAEIPEFCIFSTNRQKLSFKVEGVEQTVAELLDLQKINDTPIIVHAGDGLTHMTICSRKLIELLKKKTSRVFVKPRYTPEECQTIGLSL